MAMDFPAAPALDEVFTDPVSGKVYKFDGTAWKIDATAGMVAGDYVLKAGDTMGGVLNLINPDPATPLEATHKRYVDETIAANSLYQGTWSVAANTPDITPSAAILHSYAWIAVTANPAVPETAPAALPGIGGVVIAEGDNVIWNATLGLYQLVRGAQAVTGDFVLKTGDTMTGLLTIDGVNNPSIAINNPAGAFNNRIQGSKGGAPRWTLDLGSAVVEDANNGGSDFVIYRFANAGTYVKAMEINRNVGFMSLTSGIGFGSVAHAAGSMDLSKHISLYGGAAGTFGFNVTGSKLNYHVSLNSVHEFWVNGVSKFSVQTTTSYLNTNLTVSGQITNGTNHIKCTQLDGYGIEFYGGGFLYKRSGHGMVFRKHDTAGTPVKIENKDGSGLVNIATTALVRNVEDQIADAVGPLLARIAKLEAHLKK